MFFPSCGSTSRHPPRRWFLSQVLGLVGCWRWWYVAASGFLAPITLIGCSNHSADPEPELAPPYFVDMTATSGLNHTYRNGQEAGHLAILESLGGGVALIDYNNDGLLDIFVTGGGYYGGPDRHEIKGYPCRLFKNLGNWKFKDVTAEVGLDRLANGRPWFYTHGAAVADYDNDGWPDLLVTGWGRLALFHNEPDGRGGRRFVDVTEKAGLHDKLWSTSAAWADLDGDGYPDLYVCHYTDWSFANHPKCKYDAKLPYDVCPPKKFKALPHVLYHNNGNGTFTDVSQEAGILGPQALEHGKGLGVIILDVDGDGWPDIYVANDEKDNLLYLNHSDAKRRIIRLHEVGKERGVAKDGDGNPDGSMGVAAAAYDGSGLFSLFVTNYENESHALYRNVGNGEFVFASNRAGITAIGTFYVGFGTAFIDFDRDGAEDLFIVNGHVIRYPTRAALLEPAVLLRNKQKPGLQPQDVSFEEVSKQAGPFFATRHMARGAAFGDLDNDGRTDVVISCVNEPVILLRNNLDNGHHWLGIELIGKPYRDAVGAALTLEVGGQKLVRQVLGGGSYMSASDRRIVFGLNDQQKVGRLTVRWPSGEPRVQTWDGLAIDRYWRLLQGMAKPQDPRTGRKP